MLLGLFKFFGGLCFVRPKDMCARFQLFMKKMFAMTDPYAENVDPGNADIAMETIGLIGSTPEGKMALAKHCKFTSVSAPFVHSFIQLHG